ncbi:swr complex subunit [Saxophila tyrrhenica]|uniref:SWR1-complex protein 5 n=1 Tax=Saxophila tyrrhenica TaxID=1690608 RepID=A0AAV9P2M8_9PEZI|nr:swr complex subunit [Saxophila tyrrhenica]
MAHQIQDVDAEPEETYDENADEDFNPDVDNDGASASASSEDDEETTTTKKSKPTQKRKATQASLDADLDSGDEATINERKSKKRRRKHGKHQPDAPEAADEDESAGEGGLIKTRAQRLAEKVERKQRKREPVGEVTIDVDAVWAELSGLGVGRETKGFLQREVGKEQDGDGMDVDAEGDKENIAADTATKKAEVVDEEDMITITRLINYAGETTSVSERVPRASKEAQQYLASHPSASQNPTPTSTSALHRPLRRPSLFEPNPTGAVKNVPPQFLRPRAPSRLDVVQAEKRATEEQRKKAQRMTTVQKSALDWRGFVEGEEGLKEELERYGKGGRAYLDREGFLGRVEMAREGAARDARLKA